MKNGIRKELDKIIKSYLSPEHREQILNLLTIFHSNEKVLDKEDLEIIRKFYKDHIIQEGEKISNHIGIEDIKNIVTFVSYSDSKDEIIDEPTIFKSLRIFQRVEEVFLLYTEETEKNFFKLQAKLLLSNKNVTGIKVNIDNIENVYSELRRLSIDEKIAPENTLIDITTGPKIVGISFYKLAVERGITAINWKTPEIKITRTERIPVASSLEIMIEPKNENYKTYQSINESIKNYNFMATSMLYAQLGDENMIVFYRELSSFFSLQNFYKKSREEWMKSLIEFFKEIHKKIKPTVAFLGKSEEFIRNYFSLIYDELLNNEKTEDWAHEFIKKFRIDTSKFIEDFISEEGYVLDYIVAQFLIYNFKGNSTEIINEHLEIEIYDADQSDEDLYYELNENFGGDTRQLNRFIPENILYENLRKSFSFQNGILEINRYNVEIKISEKAKENKIFKELLGKSIPARVVRAILENEKYRLSGEELFPFIINDDFIDIDDTIVKSSRKNLSAIRKFIDKFNDELKKINPNIDELVCYEVVGNLKEKSEKNPDNHRLKIAYHSFFINQKYLEI